MDRSIPARVELRTQSRSLVLTYSSGTSFTLPAEYLRVHSPSAEVRGHGFGQEKLQTGKKEVGLRGVEPVGNYGLKLSFDDGHDTGIYTWDYLQELGENQEEYWQSYLNRLKVANASREP